MNKTKLSLTLLSIALIGEIVLPMAIIFYKSEEKQIPLFNITGNESENVIAGYSEFTEQYSVPLDDSYNLTWSIKNKNDAISIDENGLLDIKEGLNTGNYSTAIACTASKKGKSAVVTKNVSISVKLNPIEMPVIFKSDKKNNECVFGSTITVNCNYGFHIESGSTLPDGVIETKISNTEYQYTNNNQTANYSYETKFISESKATKEFTINFINGDYALINEHLLPSTLTSGDIKNNFIIPGEIINTQGGTGGKPIPTYPVITFYNSPSNAIIYCDTNSTSRPNECYVMNDHNGTTNIARYQIIYYLDEAHTNVLYTLRTSTTAIILVQNEFGFSTDRPEFPMIMTTPYYDVPTLGVLFCNGTSYRKDANVSPMIIRNGRIFGSQNDSVSLTPDIKNHWDWIWKNWNLSVPDTQKYKHCETDLLYAVYMPDSNNTIDSLLGMISFPWRIGMGQSPFSAILPQ